MNSKPPPHSRSSLPSPPPLSPKSTHLPSPQPQQAQLPALPFHPPSPPQHANSPPPTYNTYHHFPHPLSILSCADLPPPTFSSNYQSPPTFKAEFRAPFFGPQQGQPNTVQTFYNQYRNGSNWGVVEGGRLAGDVFAGQEGQVGMGGGCGWWSRKIVYYSGGQPVAQGQEGYAGQEEQWQSPTPPGSPRPGGM